MIEKYNTPEKFEAGMKELRHPNEPARHKLLDLIGDLYLLGYPLRAEIVANRPGHFANTSFAKKIKENIILL